MGIAPLTPLVILRWEGLLPSFTAEEQHRGVQITCPRSHAGTYKAGI